MPWWLVYYVGNICEIKLFLSVLTVLYFVGGIYLLCEKRSASGFIFSLILFAITMFLPNAETAINIYNSGN